MNNKKINAVFLIGLSDSNELIANSYNSEGKIGYMWNGNSDFHAQITNDNISITKINLVWFKDLDYKISKPDIIVNCINDADICSKSLKKAQNFITSIKNQIPQVKVFNAPELIYKTTRNAIYENYHNLADIYIPKTVRIKPISPVNVIAEAQKNGINFPFLIRACGAHQSDGLQLIKNQLDLKKLEIYAFDGKEYYITEFVEYKNKDGFYKKARLVIMNGKILPRHYMTGETWMVHGNLHEDYMANKDDLKAEESYFLDNYDKMISRNALNSLKIIYQKSGLDYLGFDFAIMPDKSLLIFEINPAQNAFIKLDPNIFPYMTKVNQNMVETLNKTIYEKVITK